MIPSEAQVQSQSSLLALPAEIRNAIWELVNASEKYTFHPILWSQGTGGAARAARVAITRRALSEVCRQTYNETYCLPYTIAPTSVLSPVHFSGRLTGRLTSGIKVLRLEFSEYRAWRNPWPTFYLERAQGLNDSEIAALALLENLDCVILRLIIAERSSKRSDEKGKERPGMVEWMAAYSTGCKTSKMLAWEERARVQVHSVKPHIEVRFEYEEKHKRRLAKKRGGGTRLNTAAA